MDWQLDYRLTNSVLHRVWNLCPYYGWMDGWMGGWMGGWMDGWMYVCTAHIIPPLQSASSRLAHATPKRIKFAAYHMGDTVRNTRFNLNVLSLHCQMCGPCSTFSNRVASSSRSSSMSVLEFIFAVCEGAGIPLFAEPCGLNIGTLEVQTKTCCSILLVKMRTKPRPLALTRTHRAL